MARGLVAASRPDELRTHLQPGCDPHRRRAQGGLPPELLHHEQGGDRSERAERAVCVRHLRRPARLPDHSEDARHHDARRDRGPSGPAELLRRSAQLPEGLLRGADVAAVPPLRQGAARSPEVSRDAPVSWWAAGAALRQRRVDAAHAHGRGPAADQDAVRSEAREADRRTLSERHAASRHARLSGPGRLAERLLRGCSRAPA